MNENATRLLEEIRELNKEVSEKETLITEEFKKDIESYFLKNGIQSVKLGVNNHEFNDGSPTSFYLYYDEPEIVFNDGDWEHLDEKGIVTDGLRRLISSYELFSIYETLFGNCYDGVSINLNSENKFNHDRY